MAENSFSHQLLVSLCSCREVPMLRADISVCHERLRRLETHALENPAARSAGPTQNGASPRPRKESAPGEPNTSEWDARWRFFPEARVYPNWNSAARDDPARQRF